MAVTVGTKLGAYDILEEIGHGGMATVYRAYQRTVDRDVAIKIILKDLAAEVGAVQRFQREARLIARLEHPHILPVYDFDGANEPPYIVMRFLEGGTLKEVLAHGLLPIEEVAYLMRQVCSALDYAHRQGSVHRDIKPSNILVDREGNAFISDFGLAHIMESDAETAQITRSGLIVGTPDYMSPEQALGIDDVDPRADLYALGVTLFQMLTGELPFTASSSIGLLLMHTQEPIPSARAIRSDLSPAIEDVIQCAMAKRREDRYKNAAEMSLAISEALGGPLIMEHPSRLQEAAGTSLLRRVGGRSRADSKNTPTEQNKTVAALNAKAAEYAELIEAQHGGEAVRPAITALWEAFENIVTAQGGAVFARTDTELLALWGAESTHEDDAEQAVRAALSMQEQMRAASTELLAGTDDVLPFSIGLHTGLALLTPNRETGLWSASGATLNLANRLMERAEGTILISHEVFRQTLGVFSVRPDEPLKTRGRTDLISTYRVLAAKARAFRIGVRGIEGVETRLIGRDAELKTLEKAFLTALEDSETQVVTIVAEAGVGKSRLLYEFDKWTELRPEIFRILRARAMPDNTERPYGVIRDLIAFRFEILDNDTPGIVRQKMENGVTALIGADVELAHTIGYLCGFDFNESEHIKGRLDDVPGLVRRGRGMFVRLITSLAKIDPATILIDDIHYADEPSLDLLNELFTADAGLRLLVVSTTRPLLYERRESWGSGQPFHKRLDLKPLDKRDSRELVREILQKVGEVPTTLRDLLVERAEGNPYYLEELVKTLSDDRVIVKEDTDHWRVEESRLGALTIPATLLGLLESRLDTLLYPEKLTLQRAAVLGRVFYDRALLALDSADEMSIGGLPGVLHQLTEREFIERRETTAFADTIEYTFHSGLMRDAIYNALLRRQITVYNRAAADWLVAMAGERVGEYAPQIANYYEKAGERERAGLILADVGERARTLGALLTAKVQLTRAWLLLPESADEARQTLALNLGRVYRSLGDYADGLQILDQVAMIAQRRGDADGAANGLSTMALIWMDKGDNAQAKKLLDEAAALTPAPAATQSRTFYLSGWLAYLSGDWTRVEEAAAAGLDKARAAKNPRLTINALQLLGIAAENRGDFTSAYAYVEQCLAIAKDIRNHDALAGLYLTLGEMKRGQRDFVAARAAHLEALKLCRESGEKGTEAICLGDLGLVELGLRSPAAARNYFLLGLRLAQKIGQAAQIVLNVCGLAGVRALDGDSETALHWLGLALSQPTAIDETRRDVEEVFVILGETLSEAAIQTGMEAGKALNFGALVGQLVADNERHRMT